MNSQPMTKSDLKSYRIVIVIVISKLLRRYSKDERRAAAYSQVLCHVRGVGSEGSNPVARETMQREEAKELLGWVSLQMRKFERREDRMD